MTAHGERVGLSRAACCLLALAMGFSARAEETAAIGPRQEQSRAEYEQVIREIGVAADRMAAIEAEIARVRKDHASITAALIQSAKTERKLAQDIEDISVRLDGLKGQQQGILTSLGTRRGVLAEVLGALQRMGLNPPPALLVRPEDALASVRSAILLGAVVPELRRQTDILAADLAELSRVAASIEAERQRLTQAVSGQAEEKRRLGLLLEEKGRLRSERQADLESQTRRSEELAERSKSLKELIAALDREAEAAEARRRAEAEAARRDAELAARPVPEANRLAAAPPFSALKRQIALPVIGRFSGRFGGKDGNGGVMLGDMVATQSAAIVTAPADGNVLYAGPFRSYGQLLILDVGDGYHVLLAGMARLSVAPGQPVLSGEPVGAMGETRIASAAATSGRNLAPELYVEFRKDGKPVDPSPWWTERLSGRTANGT
ncbi:MAG: peptidase [Rhizobiaceae bacterium]|nr:peptidase [Rhizobiaceae bacterium]